MYVINIMKNSLKDRIITEFPEHTKMKEWFVRAVVGGDFSNVIAALDSKLQMIEVSFPERFRDAHKPSFTEMLERNREQKQKLQDKGLMHVLNESKNASQDYERISLLKKEVEFFQDGFKLIRESFGGADHLNVALLRAVNGVGVEELQEALTSKVQGAISLLPRKEDGSLPFKDYIRTVDEWKDLLNVAREMIGLKVQNHGRE